MAELDLREALDSSFESASATEPTLPSPHLRVIAARSALRRRRVIAAAFAAAAVSAVVWGSTRVSEPAATEQSPIKQPTSGPSDLHVPLLSGSERRLTLAAAVDERWRDSCGHTHQPSCHGYSHGAAPVALSANGTLSRISSDVIIEKQVEDRTPPTGGHQIEVEVRRIRSIRVQWWVLTRQAGTMTARVADPSHISFTTWAHGVNKDVTVAGAPILTKARVVLDR
jgi:hypothetical protein